MLFFRLKFSNSERSLSPAIIFLSQWLLSWCYSQGWFRSLYLIAFHWSRINLLQAFKQQLTLTSRRKLPSVIFLLWWIFILKLKFSEIHTWFAAGFLFHLLQWILSCKLHVQINRWIFFMSPFKLPCVFYFIMKIHFKYERLFWLQNVIFGIRLQRKNRF